MTPFADTDTVPVPSDEIVAPPKLIVVPDKNNSPQRLEAVPVSYTHLTLPTTD